MCVSLVKVIAKEVKSVSCLYILVFHFMNLQLKINITFYQKIIWIKHAMKKLNLKFCRILLQNK